MSKLKESNFFSAPAIIFYGIAIYGILQYYINDPLLPHLFSTIGLIYICTSFLLLLIFKKQYIKKFVTINNRTFHSDLSRIIALKNNGKSYFIFIIDLIWLISIFLLVGMGIACAIFLYVGFKLKGL